MAEVSIFRFLPRLHKRESGALQWPCELESLLSGPSVRHVRRSEALCDLINQLREQSLLPVLSDGVFLGLITYFDEVITRAAAQNFFERVLPFMADLAHRLPELLNKHFDQPLNSTSLIKLVKLRVLEPQQAGLVYMSQELVAAILACAFFCLYPLEGRAEARLPRFNFDGLFHGRISRQQENKIHCILHYFTRVSQAMPQGMISFERKVLPQHREREVLSPIAEPGESYWSSSSSSFCPIQVFENGRIEDQSLNALEIDFANQFLGGGVLGHGCVQEEIRFVISPELLAGMLFIPAMHANEAIEIRGVERFSHYTGYSSTFLFAGDYVDTKQRDPQGRLETRIVAIDALEHPGNWQFEEELMVRETNKAFCGFLDHLESHFISSSSQKREPSSSELQLGIEQIQTVKASKLYNVPLDSCCMDLSSTEGRTEKTDDKTELTSYAGLAQTSSTMGIATGNWGCGAFGGDVELKSLLQWIAASQAGRPFLQYFTFGGSHAQRLQQVADWIIKEKWVVGELWGLLVDYGKERLKNVHKQGLFEWILPHLAKADELQGKFAHMSIDESTKVRSQSSRHEHETD